MFDGNPLRIRPAAETERTVGRIAISGLSKRFGANLAVADLSLDIDDGQFVTLLGASGCGKTTTLRMLAGFLTPDAGEIRVDGRLLSAAGGVVPPERRGMGMVFQNYALWPHMSVFENVAFGLRAQRLRRAAIATRVTAALRLVGLDHLASRFPGYLSGGQQQRVALARSMVVEPAVLLLDEPLSNLDAKLRERMRAELKELQRRTRITFVYVTHDQTEALALSDRIAVMHEGVLQQYATPFEIYDKPASAHVAEFIGSTNWISGRVSSRAEDDLGRLTLESGDTLCVVLPAGAKPDDRIRVSIRPEDVRLDAGASHTGVNALHGCITDIAFLGSSTDYQVTIGSLILRAQTGRASLHLKGDAVDVHIDPRRCLGMPL